jgi:hypothetical protein
MKPEDTAALPDRITIDHLNSIIVAEQFERPIGTTLTICILSLRNGFTVTGESACVDPANFDKTKGEEIARANAFDKLWPLEGYLLAERRYQAQGAR